MEAIKRFFLKLITPLQKWALKRELKRSIEAAKEMRYRTHKKHLVLFYKGEFRVYERNRLKQLIADGMTFRKGTKIKDLDKKALFITD